MKSKLTEAFKAGNRARKKESTQDAVQSVDDLQAQIDLFKKQTGYSLEIRDGRLYYDGHLDLSNYTGLTSLPDGLTVRRNLFLTGCTGLTSLPQRLTIKNCLDLADCTGLTELPSDLTVKHYIFSIPDSLRPFIERLGIKIDTDGDIVAGEWMEKRHLVSQMDEAFKAGNRTRKKESVQDQTESAEGRHTTNYKRKDLTKSNISKAIAESIWKWCPEIFTPEAVEDRKWEYVDEFGGGVTVYIEDLSESGFNTGYIPIGDSDLSVSGIWIYFNLGQYSDPSKAGTFFMNVAVYDELICAEADLIGMGFKNDAGYWSGEQIQIGMRDMPDGLRETLYKTNCEVFGDYWGYEPETADVSVLEAFRAGNRSRKKDVFQDTVAVTGICPYTDIDGIMEIFNRYKEFRYDIRSESSDKNIIELISDEFGDTVDDNGLTYTWNADLVQNLEGDDDLGYKPDECIIHITLSINGGYTHYITVSCKSLPDRLTATGFVNLMESKKSINDNIREFFGNGYVKAFIHDMTEFWHDDLLNIYKTRYRYSADKCIEHLTALILAGAFVSRMPGGDYVTSVEESDQIPENPDHQMIIIRNSVFNRKELAAVFNDMRDGDIFKRLIQRFGQLSKIPDWTAVRNFGIFGH